MRRGRSIFGVGVMTPGDALEAPDNTDDVRLSQFFIEVGLGVLPVFPPAPASPCEGDGIVNLAADPDDGEPLATSRTPLIWSVLHLDEGDVALSYLPFTDPTTYHAGRKEPRILSMGRVRHAMSDRFGGPQTSQLEMIVADLDRLFRGRMREETFLNREWSVWMADNAVRKAQGDARRIGHYAIVDYKPIGGLGYRFVGEDFLGAEVSHFFAEQPIDLPVFSRRYFPQLSRDLDGKTIPPYYGFVSDESLPTSAEDPVVLNPSAGGYGGDIVETVFPRFGWETIGGNAPASLAFVDAAGGSFSSATTPTLYGFVTAVIDGHESDPYPLPPPASLSLTGSGKKVQMSTGAVTGAEAYRWYLSDVPIGSHHSLPATFGIMKETTGTSTEFTSATDGSPLPDFVGGVMWAVVIAKMADGLTVPQSSATVDTGVAQHEGFLALGPYPDRGTVVAWDPAPGALEYWVYFRWSSTGSSFGAADSYTMRFIVDASETTFTFHYGDVGELVTGLPGTETELGAVPCRYVGEFVNPDGVTRSGFVVAFGTMGDVQSLFGSDGGTPTPRRVKVADALYGTTVFCPRRTGWQYPNNYVEITSTTDEKMWTTMVFVDPGHPIAIAAKDGTIELTANVCGYTTTSDGSDETISSGFRQVLHFLTNFGPREDGAWRSGDWKQIPTRQGVPIYRSSDFEAAKVDSEAIVDGGFECAWGVGINTEAPKLFDFLASAAINLYIRWRKNEHGQLGMKMLDLNADSVADFTDRAYDPANGIGGIPNHADIEVIPNTQGIVNWINFVYKQNYIQAVTNPTPEAEELLPPTLKDTPDWYSGRQKRTSEAGYNAVNRVWKPVDIQYAMHRDSRAPIAITVRYLALWSTPIDRYVIPASLLGADVHVGDVVTVTHHAGSGADGALSRRVWLIDREIDTTMQPGNPSTFDIFLGGDDITDVEVTG